MYLVRIFSIFSFFILECLAVQKSTRKLDFLFRRDDFYCPLNHKKSSIEDLCYLVSHKKKSSYQEADDHCQKKSHRLVQIDNLLVWSNIKLGLDKMFDSLNINNLNLSFYVAANHSLVELYKEKNFFCNKTNTNNTKNSCVELRYLYSNQNSLICLSMINCKKHRYAFCEWRGDNIQSYNINLKSQILNCFFSILFALGLFILAWTLIYFNHKHYTKSELNHLFDTYLKEKQIFK